MPRVALALLLLLPACHAAGRHGSDDATATAGVVDSVRPRGVELAEFRVGLDSITELQGGQASRDALVEAFVAALERRDTAAFAPLVLSKAEFAHLYYPTTPQALPPYDLSPELLWFMVSTRSEKGVRHALEERGGAPLGYLGYECPNAPSAEGANTVWGPCVIHRLQAPGDTLVERLFGPIIQRGGQYKFVSLANKLD